MGKLKRAYWTRLTLSGTGRRPKKEIQVICREKERNSSGKDEDTTSS
jgi:hypothetical protein